MRFSNLLMGIGALFLIVGFIIKISPLKLFHLPGDIIIRKKNFTFYFPVTSSIILSILLSLIFYIISKFK